MAQRITWQNVAAPNFNGAAQALVASGELLSDGLSSLGTTVKGIDQGRRQTASDAAMLRALEVNNLADWDRILQNEGVEKAFGISGNQMTDGFRDFLTGRRKTLLENQNTASLVDWRSTQIEDARERNERADWRFDNEVAAHDLSQSTKAVHLAAGEKAQELAHGSLSREEAKRNALDLGLSRTETDAILGSLDQLPADYWTHSSGALGAISIDPKYAPITESITAAQHELDNMASSNTLARYYIDGQKRYSGAAEPVTGLTNELKSRVTDDEDGSLFKQSAGQITGIYNDLRKDYKDLPPEVIAEVMRNELEQGGWFNRDKIQIDKSRVHDVLKELNDPLARAALRNEIAGIDRLNTEITEAQRLLAETQSLDARSRTLKEGEDGVFAARRDAAMEQLLSHAAGFAPAPTVPGPETPPAKTPSVIPTMDFLSGLFTSPDQPSVPEPQIDPAFVSASNDRLADIDRQLSRPGLSGTEQSRLIAQRHRERAARDAEINKATDTQQWNEILASGQFASSVSAANPNRPRSFFQEPATEDAITADLVREARQALQTGIDPATQQPLTPEELALYENLLRQALN